MIQFLTGIFKLHNPSQHKQRVLDHALLEYTRGYQTLLDYAHEHIDVIQKDGKDKNQHGVEKYTSRSVAKFLPRNIITADIHGSMKESLRQNVAATLASYCALVEVAPKTSFPTCRDPFPTAYPNALDNFILVGSSVEDYNRYKDELLTKLRGSFMPLLFAGADGASQDSHGRARNRYFSLLRRTDKEQILAVLYLLPANHTLGKPINARRNNLARLDTGEVFHSNSKSAILLPIELGKSGWQMLRFLEPAMRGQSSVKSAYLIRNDERHEYFLHVSFAIECAPRYEPQAWLGVDKGILFTAAYGIVDLKGRVQTLGHFDDDLRKLQIKHGKERERLSRQGKPITWRHYKRRAYDNILQCLANQLIEMALENQAGIVVEDLSNIKVRGKRVRSRFRKLDNMLCYKCKIAGIPYRTTFAAYSSQICHKCGELLRRDNRRVECLHCGYVGHSDDNAAVNIARRALYHKAEWKDRGGYRGFHQAFAKL